LFCFAFLSFCVQLSEADRKYEYEAKHNVEKSDRTKEFLRRAIMRNSLFQHLDSKQLDAIVDSMFRVEAKPGDHIIRQGDRGDFFYVVEKGCCEVFVRKAGSAESVNVNDPKLPGLSFGELALLYNAPRNATVSATVACTLWAVGRKVFQEIVVRLSTQRVAEVERMLRKVPLLSMLQPDELLRLVNAIEVRAYTPNTLVVAQVTHFISLATYTTIQCI
jgi:cAMP-dependent protein kinase regulator